MQDEAAGMCFSYNTPQTPFVMVGCNSTNENMVWSVVKHLRYRQLFKIVHQASGECLDVIGKSSTTFSTPLQLSDCEEFSRDEDGVWTDQWWRFDEYVPLGA